ncbi:cupin domain-containing protein [Kitasatospora purpeofusca]|uniref:cupin domain-containing protein n=1 Tax=Kitasatospora purpeofusca TaxID=67352 RepID=UPI003F4AB4AE
MPPGAGPGGFFFVPRGTRHRFRNGGYHAARMVLFFTPGGIEELLLADAIPARPGTAPPIRRSAGSASRNPRRN